MSFSPLSVNTFIGTSKLLTQCFTMVVAIVIAVVIIVSIVLANFGKRSVITTTFWLLMFDFLESLVGL